MSIDLKVITPVSAYDFRDYLSTYNAMDNFDTLDCICDMMGWGIDTIEGYVDDEYGYEVSEEDLDNFFYDETNIYGFIHDSIMNSDVDEYDAKFDENEFEELKDVFGKVGAADLVDERWLFKPSPEQTLIDEHYEMFDAYTKWMHDEVDKDEEYIDEPSYPIELKMFVATVLVKYANIYGISIDAITDMDKFVDFCHVYADVFGTHDEEQVLYNFCVANEINADTFR